MIKAVALDDEPPALDIIESFCSLTADVQLVKTFTRAEEALKYLSAFPVDLLFLDINMPAISGIDFKKKLSTNTSVIFTTAYSEFAVEAFNLNALDYLLKPFTPERFLQGVEKAKTQYRFLHQDTQAKPDYVTIRVDFSLVKLPLADIVFIEGLDDYLKIHLLEQRPIIARITMKEMTEKLPQNDFVRVHRSYIVSLAKIESVRNKTIFIGKEKIPIGASYEKGFYEVFGK